MVASFQPQSTPWHRLTRFVSKNAIARLLHVKPEDIREIRRWAKVLLVVGQHVSRFVSYADLPPIIRVALPQTLDFQLWRKRWGKYAPDFWAEFYAQEIKQALYVADFLQWGELVAAVTSLMSPTKAQWLRDVYADREFECAAF